MPRSALLFLAAGCIPSLLSAQPAGGPGPGAQLSPRIEARIDALLAGMSLEEKVGQLNQIATDSKGGPGELLLSCDDLVRKGWVGAILGKTAARDTNLLQREAVEESPRHIPILFGMDVIHGFRTTFPIPLGLSASWDPGLVERTARLAAGEASRQGVRWAFSPMVDIARDPRWGRIAEGSGEDPYLGSAMARAYVLGYQGRDLGAPDSIMACAKHFVGYGAAEAGRDYNTTEISERTLREVYLPPFHAAVDQGAGTLMSAFNAINGVPSSANAFTLGQVLRKEWGFQGFVDSDWTAVRELMLHGIADDEATAARKSFLAGVDMDMQSGLFLRHLPDLVRSGAVPMAGLDDSVRRILRMKFALGLFDRPYVAEPVVPDPAAAERGRALALQAADESLVLLENLKVGGSPLLPLSAGRGKRIALIGPLADSADDMLGCWSCEGRPGDMVTLRSALAARATREGFSVSYAKGTGVDGKSESGFAEAVRSAKAADLVVMALGESRDTCGEASSRSTIDLPGNQEKLLEAVVSTGKPVVLVVFSGRPLAISWASTHVPAVLMAWFPGEEAGNAIVSTLFGDSEPEGRLTVSIPRALGQVPIYYNSLNTGRPQTDPIGNAGAPADDYYVSRYVDLPNSPLYPFGYGLSYTHYRYSGVSVDTKTLSAAAVERGGASLTVGAEVRNTGSREGTEVVQLYIRLRGTSVARPVRELKGFERVHLAPGETKHVAFKLGRDELAIWGIEEKWAVEPCSLYVWVAPDSVHGVPARVEIGE